MYELNGQFTSTDGHAYGITIHYEADGGPIPEHELRFPFEEPLILEWEEVEPGKAIQHTSATLTLLSPGDRTYEKLYTDRADGNYLIVYRDGAEYWTGYLDSEQYEEPYATRSDYPVTLTFSTFGHLSRSLFSSDPNGFITLGKILDESVGGGVEYLTSTKLPSGAELREIAVPAANFYDEDGKAATMEEAIEAFLAPLALRLTARQGRKIVYDTNHLAGVYYESLSDIPGINWASTDQMLSVGRIYNDITITHSPYPAGELIKPAQPYGLKTDPTLRNLNSLDPAAPPATPAQHYYTYHAATEFDRWEDPTDHGFSLWLTAKGSGATLHNSGSYTPQYYKIIPHASGSDSQGIALRYHAARRTPGTTAKYEERITPFLAQGQPDTYLRLGGTADPAGDPVVTFNDITLPPATGDIRLHITLPLLIDPRHNPFEQAKNLTDGADYGNQYNEWETNVNFLYLPIRLTFTPTGYPGHRYTWDNRGHLLINPAATKQPTTIAQTLGQWYPLHETKGEDAAHLYAHLAYYDPQDRKEKSGTLGYRDNRQAINPHTQPLAAEMEAATGQYLTLPPESEKGGTLSLQILTAPYILKDTVDNRPLPETAAQTPANIQTLWSHRRRWTLIQMPAINLTHTTAHNNGIDAQDIEYHATLNPAAREHLEIETTCGTPATPVPSSRGTYHEPAGDGTYQPLTALTRGLKPDRTPHTATAEELLISTLYTAHATRRLRLTGTIFTHRPPADTPTGRECADLLIHADPSTPHQPPRFTRLLLAASVEDPAAGTAEATFTEISPDQYLPAQ